MRYLKTSPLKSSEQSKPFVPDTRIVGAFKQVPLLIQQLGADPASVLAEARLTPEDLAESSQRVPYQSLMVLLNEAAIQTKCVHFGLLAGYVWHLSDLGPMGELMRNSRTVGVALEELVLFQHLNSQGAAAFLLQSDASVDLGYTFYIPLVESTSQFYDAVLAAAANFMRELCGDEWAPSAVFFPHSAPSDLEPYQQHFRAELIFDSTICALRFSTKDLGRPMVGADLDLFELALEQLKLASRGSFVDIISRTLRTLLLHGIASGDTVARTLAMHRRTLSRRLKEEGVTFQQILDRVRFAIAKELLEDSKVPPKQIAASLSFSDTESFYRAFKRWTGTTPGAWRESPH